MSAIRALKDYVLNPVKELAKDITGNNETIITHEEMRRRVEEKRAKREVEERIARQRVKIWKPILQRIPEYRALSPKGKRKALKVLRDDPEKFLKVLEKTRSYGQLSEEAKKNLKLSLYAPFNYKEITKFRKKNSVPEIPLEAPYVDPTSWAGIGITFGLKAIPPAIIGETAGELAGREASKILGENAFTEEVVPLATELIFAAGIDKLKSLPKYFQWLSKLDEFFYKELTGLIEDTPVDRFFRKYLLADKYGIGGISRKKEDQIISEYYKLKAHLSRGDISAEKKEQILNKYLNKLNEGERKTREKFIIQYLENPSIREAAKKELPELTKELDKIRREIDRLGKLKMERGLITPSQFEKWKDKYLTRLYVMDEIEGIDVIRGLKQYKEEKGRKIESIVDYIEELKKSDPLKAQEWQEKAILDPIKAIKVSIGKNYTNLAIDEFYRKILDDDEITLSKYLVELPIQINRLPSKMSPYFAENRVLPYLRDLLKKDSKNKELRNAIRSLRKQIKAKKDLIESEKDILEKKGYRILGDKKEVKYGVISGLPVNRDIANFIEGITRIIENPQGTANKLDKFVSAAVSYFKWAKVPANIFSYPRNMVSNWFQWTLSGAEPTNYPIYIGKALFSFAKKDKPYQLARKHGLFHSTLASEEINRALRELKMKGSGTSIYKQAFNKLLTGMEKVGEAYGLIDDLAKLARFKYAVEVERKPIKEAIRIAQDTHFDYSLTYPIIKAMREPNINKGVALKLVGTLFPTYTHKAISFLYDTTIKRPATLAITLSTLMFIKNMIEERNKEIIGEEFYEKLKRLRPEFLDSVFVIPYIDKEGKWATFVDLSYIIPFGNLVNAATNLMEGNVGNAMRELGALANPIYSLKALEENRDTLTGRQIYYPWDTKEKIKDVAKYIANQFFAPGTISKLIAYSESKHPVIPRIITGTNIYQYPIPTLLSYGLNNINRIKFDTRLRKIRIRKHMEHYIKAYNDGKITKEELDKKLQQLKEEYKRWDELEKKAIEREMKRQFLIKHFDEKATKEKEGGGNQS